ncbi:MAG TPA: tail fiber protein [Pyrinomonadaceae bacterium]|nr:tail fiber protein [Pyrinomonadaceae bacterium]
MAEPFIGMIVQVGFTFAPRGWAFCNGQILAIAQNTALFSLLGTTYGGNGQTTFALPDLRSRVPIHPGQGPGLSPYSLGQAGGTENTTLSQNNLPAHSHTLTASTSGQANAASPANNFLGVGKVPSSSETVNMYNSAASPAVMNAASITGGGGNQPFSIVQPYLCINFIIALEGIFPSRN